MIQRPWYAHAQNMSDKNATGGDKLLLSGCISYYYGHSYVADFVTLMHIQYCIDKVQWHAQAAHVLQPSLDLVNIRS